MYKTWYEIESVYRRDIKLIGDIAAHFETYDEAYRFMCKSVAKQIDYGCKVDHWQIMRHDYSEYNGTRNEMVQPVWE